MTEEERREEILKQIKKARRRSFKYIEWKILAFVVIVILLFSIGYSNKVELERFLNPIYYEGAEHNNIVSLSDGDEAKLKVHFIDVGCADATFIELPNNKTMLIDCAGDSLEKNNSINALLRYLEIEIFEDREEKILDYLVVTHPDRDHYLGAKSILKAYDVKNIIRPIVLSETEKSKFNTNQMQDEEDLYPVKVDSEYEEFITFVERELKSSTDVRMFYGKAGLDFSESEYSLEFIAPNNIDYDDEWNNYSSCIRLKYLGKTFLFMGDAEISVENELVNKYSHNIGYLSADILKLGHHGSKTSTSHLFMNAVSPKYCVASTRAGVYSNVPSNEVIYQIEITYPNTELLRTDINGNIVFSVSKRGNLGLYTTRGSFDFVSKFIYIKLYYVLIVLSLMFYIFIFEFRALTRADILEMRRKNYEKEKKKMLKLTKKRYGKKWISQ